MGIFNKKTWLPRIVPFPNRRRLITVEPGIVDVIRAEGTPTQEGDSFNNSTFNDFEGRIELAFEKLGGETYATRTDTSITENNSVSASAIVSKISGATTATRPNTSADVSPDNVQTFTDASNFTITANNGSGTSNSFIYSGKLGKLTQGSNVISNATYNEDTGIFKSIEPWSQLTFVGATGENWTNVSTNTNTARFDINGLAGGLAVSRDKIVCNRFKSIYGDNTDTEHCRNSTSDFPMLFSLFINKTRITGWSDSLTSAQKVTLFKTWLASNPLIVRYELAVNVETVIPVIPLLDTYNGTTNIITTSSPQVELEVNLKSSAWMLQNKKLDKTDVINNLSTTEPGKALDARMGKQLNDTLTGMLFESTDAYITGAAFTKPTILTSICKLRGVDTAGNIIVDVQVDGCIHMNGGTVSDYNWLDTRILVQKIMTEIGATQIKYVVGGGGRFRYQQIMDANTTGYFPLLVIDAAKVQAARVYTTSGSVGSWDMTKLQTGYFGFDFTVALK